jgi:hypothetical protein
MLPLPHKCIYIFLVNVKYSSKFINILLVNVTFSSKFINIQLVNVTFSLGSEALIIFFMAPNFFDLLSLPILSEIRRLFFVQYIHIEHHR